MTQIWQQIRLGKHVGFEEGELADIEWWWEADGGFPSVASYRGTT